MAFLTQEQANALAATTVRVAFLDELRFATQTMRLWNGAGPADIDGHEWEGAGSLASVEGLEQVRSGESAKVTQQLSGVSDEVVRLAKNEVDEVQGRKAFMWLQLFDDDWRPLGAKIALFWGVMQRLLLTKGEAREGGGQFTAGLEIENAFAGRSRPPSRRFTDADQNALYPGDKFCRFVSQQKEQNLTWPDF